MMPVKGMKKGATLGGPQMPSILLLGFLDSEYLCSTLRAGAGGGRSLILESDFSGILDLDLRPAFYAIRLCHGLIPSSLVESGQRLPHS